MQKNWLVILLATAIGFGAGAFLFSDSRGSSQTTVTGSSVLDVFSKSDTGSGTGANADRGRPFRSMRPDAPAGPQTPAEVLERLKAFRVPAGAERRPALRRVVHLLETLVDAGPAALPSIREFLTKFEDVDYGWSRSDLASLGGDRSAGDMAAASEPSSTPRPVRLEFDTPPSLRLGLVDVLKSIGGEPAEQVLAELLRTSGRGVEVAYVAHALQNLAPGKHRETALAAAKELLANPPKLDHPGPLDENSHEYLYSVLYLYGDLSFASNLQTLLVAADGSIDRTTLKYLITASPEAAVPVLYEAYKDARVTNVSERTTLAAQILSHAGTNQQANDILREIVIDERSPSWMRVLSIQSLAGGRGGPFSGVMPVDEAVLQGRITLLASLPETTDDTINRAIDDAVEKLSNRLGTVRANDASAPTFRVRPGPQ